MARVQRSEQFVEELLNRKKRVTGQGGYYYNWHRHWEEIAEYIYLNKQGIIRKRIAGEDITDFVYDTTAIDAGLRLGSMMYAMMFNPETQFFKFKINASKEIADNMMVKRWLEYEEEQTLKDIRDSNFATQIFMYLSDLIFFATGNIMVEEGRTSLLNFRSYSPENYYPGENDEGYVDIIYLEYEYTIRQLAQWFGEDNLSAESRKKFAEGNGDEKIKVTHAVLPREERFKSGQLNTNMPYAAYWIEDDEKHIMSESGFMEFPYYVTRWTRSTGEVYGRGPTTLALPDVRTKNSLRRDMILMSQRRARPAWDVEDGAYTTKLKTGPDRVNFRNKGRERATKLHDDMDPVFTLEMDQMLKDSINDKYYVNQLQLIDRAQMTATEVVQRTQENIRIMAQPFIQIVNEMMDPMISRIFAIRQRAGVVSPPPEILEGVELKIEYDSPIARVIKGSDLESVAGGIEYAANLANLFGPQVLDNIDPDSALRSTFEMLGVPASMIQPLEIRDQIRQSRQVQQAEAAAQQAMVEGAEVNSKLQGGMNAR